MQEQVVFQELGLLNIINNIEPCSLFGKEKIRCLSFYKDQSVLIDEFTRVEIVGRWDKKHVHDLEGIFRRLKDLRHSIVNCGKGLTLNIVEIYEIKKFCILMERIKEILSDLEKLPDLQMQTTEGILKILDPQGKRAFDFVIDGSFSYEMQQIREKKRGIDQEIESGKGIASELRAQRDKLAIAEQVEEHNICQTLSKKIECHCSTLIDDCEVIAYIDLLLCKAHMISSSNAVLPTITENHEIIFREMFHPEVSRSVKSLGHQFIPIDISIGKGATVITGANMGGKSVALKTLGLNVALAMCGWPVFAKQASLPVIEDICYIGVEQCEKVWGLSSFGKEMHDLIETIKNIGHCSLLLLDEPAKGTNPEEGAAIVKGIVKHLSQSDGYSIIATHYDGVAMFATRQYRVLGIRDADELGVALKQMNEFDASIFGKYMNYGLCETDDVLTVPREAITICQLLGMPQNIIDEILSLLK